MAADFTEDAKNELQKHYLGPFWRPFIVAWAVCNWKAVYVTIFVSEEAIQRLGSNDKLSYILCQLYDFTLFWCHLSWLKIILFCIAIPTFVAWVNTFLIARHVRHWFVMREFNNEKRERLEKIDGEKEIIKKRGELFKEKETAIQEEKKAITAEKEKTKTEEEIWLEEYNDFKQNKSVYGQFFYVYQSIYNHSGWIGWTGFKMLTQAKAWLHANDVIIQGKTSSGGSRLELTPKWVFFMKKYLEENPDPQEPK